MYMKLEAEKYYYLIDYVVYYYQGSTHILQDPNDLRSYLHVEYTKLLDKYDPSRGEVEIFLKYALFSKARRYFIDIQKKYLTNVILVENFNEYQSNFNDKSNHYELEEVFEHATEEQTELLQAILKEPDRRLTTVARRIGMHHEKAKRELMKLRKAILSA